MREILSTKNQTVIEDCKLLDKKHRDESGQFLVPSVKLVKEALKANCKFVRVYVDETKVEEFGTFLTELSKKQSDVDFIVTKSFVLEKLIEAKSSQGIVAVMKKEKARLENTHNRALILENLQDPSNVGALIRTAVGADFLDIYLVDCADPFSQKAMRSSMSGIFKVNLNFCSLVEALERLNGSVILCGDMNGENIFDAEIVNKNVAVAVGNEGNGVTSALQNSANLIVKIPMQNDLESLNVAISGSILMYQISKGK